MIYRGKENKFNTNGFRLNWLLTSTAHTKGNKLHLQNRIYGVFLFNGRSKTKEHGISGSKVQDKGIDWEIFADVNTYVPFTNNPN